MNIHTLRPFALDLPSADERSLISLHDHQNTMQRLNHSDAIPVSLEARLPGWRNLDPNVRCWAVWNEDDSSIIANVWTELATEGKNARVVNFNIMVQPAYRRRGLGQKLLAAVAEYARDEGGNTLITQTSRHRPEGEMLMQRIGALPSLESRSNRLVLANADQALLNTWIHRAAHRATGYRLEFWSGAYPEHELDAIVYFHTLHDNVSPLSSDSDEVELDTQYIQRKQDELFNRGFARWTAVVREPLAGRLVGITEIVWNIKQPEVVEQGITVVLPEHRELGLGRWLKAAMAEKVLRELPDAQVVHTGNAASNTAMLKLNADMGFVPLSEDTWWEMNLAQVQAYLQHSGVRIQHD